MIERRVAVLARRRKLLEEPLSAIHESGARVIKRKRKGAALRHGGRIVTPEARMNGDRAVDLAAASKDAAQGELDFHRIAVDLRHARKYLGGAVKAVIDEVVEPDVVVARQPDRSCDASAVSKPPGDDADDEKCERQKQRRQLNHGCRPRDSVTNWSIGPVVDALAQILARLEMRDILAR